MNKRPEDRFLVSMLADLTDPAGGAGSGRRIAEEGGALDWDYLFRKMFDEGVLNLFYYYLRRHHLQGLLPGDLFDLLAKGYYANLRRNIIASAALKPVFDTLSAQGIPFIVLKGIALAELVYPGFGIRGMSDADLLVRKGDMERTDSSLSGMGYSARDSAVPRALDNPVGYLASLDYRKNDGSLPNLHIHWHPVNTSVPAFMFAGRIDQDLLWQRAVPAMVANAEVRVLCPEHLLIYLCEHALRINHSFDRLILMYDIFFILRAYREEIDWDFVVAEAGRFNLASVVFLSLSIVKEYTSLTLPEGIMQRLHSVKLTFGERLFLDLQRGDRRFRGGSIFVYLAMNRGFAAKGRFLFRTLFPPPPILMQRRYEKNREFSVSFYFRRLWEVLSHPIRVCLRDR